ncbi:purine nucleoside permease [Irpex rosettiformis]|uniref:Purine nucleoside permease n=1 Tax=Irpex rosettiformis TaxID=378272 RepID=A0ACB8UB42_9APHY|nr:purine nucleoside permease [Irpex rosettiformis]
MVTLPLTALWVTIILGLNVALHVEGHYSESHRDVQEVLVKQDSKLQPKVFIIGMFGAEGETWHGIDEFNLLEQNTTVPGFSSLYPDAHCTLDGSICQLVTGSGEINAIASLSALLYSDLFDLRTTYFLIAGIAGINPKKATIGSVTFPLYAVHVGLQFEIDAREIPPHFTTGYIPQGARSPDQFPPTIYGTEVYELNDNLRRKAMEFAQTGQLADDERSRTYRSLYANSPEYTPAAAPPTIVACDTATSDQFWTGKLLGEATENYTKLLTNGSGEYCTTQQEDNATLEALVRAAVRGKADFSRVVVLRTGSNFDRPCPEQSASDNLFHDLTGYASAIMNIRLAGVPIVMGILDDWEATFARGIRADNYVGDILGSLGPRPGFRQRKVGDEL